VDGRQGLARIACRSHARRGLVDYDPRRVPAVMFDRRSEHYRGAVGLARLILSGVSFDLGAGGVAASAFLIDMNKVFEDFVVVALREALGVSARVLVQGGSGKQLFLGRSHRIRLKPDVSLWSGDRCLFVGDVKYKRVHVDAYPNADLYQLTAYTIATGLPSGTLVYAAGTEAATRYEWYTWVSAWNWCRWIWACRLTGSSPR